MGKVPAGLAKYMAEKKSGKTHPMGKEGTSGKSMHQAPKVKMPARSK